MRPLTQVHNRKRAICLAGLVASLGMALPVQAQVEFVPTPPDQGAPNGRQRGGANRGDCLPYQGLTALVPEIDGTVWSQTASATPQFFFQIPAPLSDSLSLEFVVQDSNDSYAFREQFVIDTDADTLLISAGELAADESYSWTFSIYCDETRPSESVSVSGTVQRVSNSTGLSLTTDLSSEEKIVRLQQYAAEGIWHEAVSLAIDLYRSDPDNSDYRETLESLFEQAKLVDSSLPVHLYQTEFHN